MRTSTLTTSIAAILAGFVVSVAYSQDGQSGQTGGTTGQQSGQSSDTGAGATRPGQSSDSGSTSNDSATSGAGSRSRSASASGTTSGRDQAPSSQEFVTRAAQSNFAEIEVSKLAQSKAQNPDVKNYAKRMIDDHSMANSELAQLGKTKNLKVPDEPDMAHKAAMKLLQMKSGDQFDAAYMEQMNKDHEKAVALFQSASASPGVDKDLQAFASKTLPKLQEHHQLAMQISSKVSSGSTGNR